MKSWAREAWSKQLRWLTWSQIEPKIWWLITVPLVVFFVNLFVSVRVVQVVMMKLLSRIWTCKLHWLIVYEFLNAIRPSGHAELTNLSSLQLAFFLDASCVSIPSERWKASLPKPNQAICVRIFCLLVCVLFIQEIAAIDVCCRTSKFRSVFAYQTSN